MKAITIAILLSAAVAASAQNLNHYIKPLPPPAPGFGLVDYSLLAGTVLGRAADWASTEECVRRSWCQEKLLPGGLVRSKGGVAAYEAGSAAGVGLLQWELTRAG